MTTPIVSNESKVSPFKKAFTEPLKPQKGPVNFSFSNSLKAGYTQYHGDQVSLLGINPEAKVEYKGWYAGAGITAGTALSGKVELGKKIEFNKNWGMDVSAFASHDVNFIHSETLIDKTSNITTQKYLSDFNLDDISVKMNIPGVFRTGIKAMANYTTNDGKFTIGAGLSGQYAAKNSIDVKNEESIVTDPIQLIEYASHKPGYVLTPELSAEYRVNDRIAFEANGNFFGGEIKIKHNLR